MRRFDQGDPLALLPGGSRIIAAGEDGAPVDRQEPWPAAIRPSPCKVGPKGKGAR